MSLLLILSPASLPGQAETPVPGQRVRLHLRGTTPTPVLLLAEEEWEAVPLRSSLGLGPGGLELRITL